MSALGFQRSPPCWAMRMRLPLSICLRNGMGVVRRNSGISWQRRTLLSPEQAIFENAIDSPESIPPAYFLSILWGTAIVGNADLIDTNIRDAGYLGCHFGLEAKALFPKGD